MVEGKYDHLKKMSEGQKVIKQPMASRQDLTGQEDIYSSGGYMVNYEDNGYVIMRSTETDSSSGVYESLM